MQEIPEVVILDITSSLNKLTEWLETEGGIGIPQQSAHAAFDWCLAEILEKCLLMTVISHKKYCHYEMGYNRYSLINKLERTVYYPFLRSIPESLRTSPVRIKRVRNSFFIIKDNRCG